MVTLPLYSLPSSLRASLLANFAQGCGSHQGERLAVQVTVTTDGPSKVLRFRIKDLGGEADEEEDEGAEEDWAVQEELRVTRRAAKSADEVGQAAQPQAPQAGDSTKVASASQPASKPVGGALKGLVTMPSVVISVVDDRPEEVLVLGLEDVAVEISNQVDSRRQRRRGDQADQRRDCWRAHVSTTTTHRMRSMCLDTSYLTTLSGHPCLS